MQRSDLNLTDLIKLLLYSRFFQSISGFLHLMPSSLRSLVPRSPSEAHIRATSTESPQATWPREEGVRGPSYIITRTHKPSCGCSNCYDTEGHFQWRYRIRPGCMGLFCHNLALCVRERRLVDTVQRQELVFLQRTLLNVFISMQDLCSYWQVLCSSVDSCLCIYARPGRASLSDGPRLFVSDRCSLPTRSKSDERRGCSLKFCYLPLDFSVDPLCCRLPCTMSHQLTLLIGGDKMREKMFSSVRLYSSSTFILLLLGGSAWDTGEYCSLNCIGQTLYIQYVTQIETQVISL